MNIKNKISCDFIRVSLKMGLSFTWYEMTCAIICLVPKNFHLYIIFRVIYSFFHELIYKPSHLIFFLSDNGIL